MINTASHSKNISKSDRNMKTQTSPRINSKKGNKNFFKSFLKQSKPNFYSYSSINLRTKTAVRMNAEYSNI